MKENRDRLTRREFLAKTSLGLLGAFVFPSAVLSQPNAPIQGKGPRQGMGNLFLKNGKPILAVAEGNNRSVRLRKGIEKIGGLEKLVKGKTVILKLNAVAPGPYPVSSDPDFVVSIGEAVIDSGAKKVSIYDSVSERMFQQMGLYEKVKKSGIELLPKDGSFPEFFTPVEKTTWEVMKKIDPSIHLIEADVVINVANCKRHGDAGFTCAMKNHFGSVYGPNRWEAHIKLHKGGSIDSKVVDESFRIPFRKLAAEFSDAIRCEMTMIDAQDLLTKRGPMLDGAEIKKGVNKLIISGDIVATDAYCSRLMAEHDPTYSVDIWEPVLQYGERLGLGTADLKKTEIIEA
jgi:uncharacterized protein (DUF362 family)